MSIDHFTIEDGQIYTNDQGVKQRIKFVAGEGMSFLIEPEYDTDSTKITLASSGGGGGGGVPTTRRIDTTAPLAGGGDLSANRTLSINGSALTKVDDTNVTLTLGGSPSTALLAAASLTLGWTGTLAAARLNANVVQSVVNDTNVTGSISAQSLTLGWTGQLGISRGGTGAGTALGAFNALSPLTTRGDLLTRDASNNVRLGIGSSGTILQSNGTDAAWSSLSSAGIVSGSGTTNKLPKWTGSTTLGDSNETDDGTTFTVGKRTAFTPVTVNITGDVDPLPIGDATIVYLNPNADGWQVGGIPNGSSGRLIKLINVATSNYSVALADNSAFTASDGFDFAGAGSYFFGPGSAIEFIYSATTNRWRPVSGVVGSLQDGTMPIARGSGAAGGTTTSTLTNGPIFYSVGNLTLGGTVLTVGSGALVMDSVQGKITTYDSISLEGEGVVPICNVVKLTGQTGGSGGSPTLFTNSLSPGLYRVECYITLTGVGTGLDSITAQIDWTDDSSKQRTLASETITDGNISTEWTTGWLSSNGSRPHSGFIQSDGSGISYSWSYTGSASGTFSIYFSLEKISNLP